MQNENILSDTHQSIEEVEEPIEKLKKKKKTEKQSKAMEKARQICRQKRAVEKEE